METTIAQVPNATKVATKWALINLAAVVIFTYAVQFLNLDANGPVKWVGNVLMITFLFLTIKEYRDELGGFMSFGQGFSAGFRYSVFAGVLAGVFVGLYYGILSPDSFVKLMQPTRAAFEQKGMSTEEVEKAMGMLMKYGPLSSAFGVAVVYAIMGAIVSLIGAAIFKKERTPEQILDELERKASITENDPTV